ncbi:MAG: hypothetical protein M1831_001583 [Alyxoria varia]|nr:MAG: hypothetical protein M1831_001583 [Alyxoria varia]
MDTNGDDSDSGVRILSRQPGAHVTCHDNNLVYKSGGRVRYNEEMAMRLVEQHTRVPVPTVVISLYRPEKGSIGMSYLPDVTLGSIWDGLVEHNRERVCREIWNMIAQWRKIQRPPHLAHFYQCLADGSPATTDPLLEDFEDPPRPLHTDEAVRVRIHQRYLRNHGERYADTLLSMLPRSSVSAFTHGDVAPRNIMVDESGHITGIIDWELAGWYPDYWEYANIWKPSGDQDWQSWMERTAPQRWDLSGITAARRVLF